MRTTAILKESFKAVVIAGSIIGTTVYIVQSSNQIPWNYSGEDGPEYWGSIDDTYKLCDEGKNQSPIDITSALDTSLPDIQFNYFPGIEMMTNKHHSILLTDTSSSEIIVNKQAYQLQQLHFHSPSEHTVNGQSFPMEIHFIHKNSESEYAVISILVKQGNPNTSLNTIWQEDLPNSGTRKKLNQYFNAFDLLPEQYDYYRYNGSLTTPPCSEGISWFVLKTPIQASESQIKQMTKLFPEGNNRPTQMLHARNILM